MEIEKKACCVRAMGWSLVGIVIALAWGIGNFTNGMGALSAFGIPALVVVAILGVVVLAALDMPWFNRLCNCPTRDSANPGKTDTMVNTPH